VRDREVRFLGEAVQDDQASLFLTASEACSGGTLEKFGDGPIDAEQSLIS